MCFSLVLVQVKSIKYQHSNSKRCNFIKEHRRNKNFAPQEMPEMFSYQVLKFQAHNWIIDQLMHA